MFCWEYPSLLHSHCSENTRVDFLCSLCIEYCWLVVWVGTKCGYGFDWPCPELNSLLDTFYTERADKCNLEQWLDDNQFEDAVADDAKALQSQ